MIAAIVLGALAGVFVESGKRGLVKRWGNADGLPSAAKVAMLGILIGVPAISAGSFGDYIFALLATVGAFTVARWSVASAFVLLRRHG